MNHWDNSQQLSISLLPLSMCLKVKSIRLNKTFDLLQQIMISPKTTTKRSAPSPWSLEYPTPSAPNRNANSQFFQVTTPKSIRTTTINSFWSEWSANKPTNLGKNEIDTHSAHAQDRFHNSNEMLRQTTPANFVRTTTPEMESWMVDILNEYSSTTTARSQFNQNNNHNYDRTPSQTTNAAVEMLPWMRDVLNEYSTTTTRKNIRFENDNGSKNNNNNGGLHWPTQNRYSM